MDRNARKRIADHCTLAGVNARPDFQVQALEASIIDRAHELRVPVHCSSLKAISRRVDLGAAMARQLSAHQKVVITKKLGAINQLVCALVLRRCP
jgi:hypothetical protein